MYIYRCEDSLECIFTAIYNVYENRHSREEVLLSVDEELRLFAEEIPVESDAGKYTKVMRTLKERFGEHNYRSVCYALASADAQKAQAVYSTVAWGLASKCGRGHLFDNLADNQVNKAFKLARNVDREYCHLRGFTRFEELENGLLYAKMQSHNHILPFLMPHFADRFPAENFVLHDTGRNLFGIHAARNGCEGWYLVQGEDFVPGELRISSEEEKYRMLFKSFCSSIAIESRRNPVLQRNMLPLHFREYMTEFR